MSSLSHYVCLSFYICIFDAQLSPIVITPHRSTVHVDAAYCCRPSSVVYLSIGLSVYRSVTLVSSAEMAEPITMAFGVRTWVGPGNHVLDGDPDPPWEGAIFWREGASHYKV